MEDRDVSRYARKDADILISCDHSGSGSEIEIEYRDGTVTGIPVPYLDDGGLPAAYGIPPSVRDLARIANLVVDHRHMHAALGDATIGTLAVTLGRDDPAGAGDHVRSLIAGLAVLEAVADGAAANGRTGP